MQRHGDEEPLIGGGQPFISGGPVQRGGQQATESFAEPQLPLILKAMYHVAHTAARLKRGGGKLKGKLPASAIRALERPRDISHKPLAAHPAARLAQPRQ